jgi:superfamily II DNA or RNA helicase
MSRAFTHRQRAALYLAAGGKCSDCGEDLGPGWHADHRQPWSKGGETDVVNGQALCPTCNLKKGAKTMKTPRPWQQRYLDDYFRELRRNYLAVISTGAGKTGAAAWTAQELLALELVRAVLVIVPSARLCKQTPDAFHEFTNLQLDPKWDGLSPLVHKNYVGAVVTYQWVAQNAKTLAAQIAKQSTLVIYDEIHHVAEEKSWGYEAERSLSAATYRLFLTATPFRTDKDAILYLNYNETGRNAELKAVPDFSYPYGAALAEGVVLPVVFHRYGGQMEWTDEEGDKTASFDARMDEKGKSRRLRTAIMAQGNHLIDTIKDANRKLEEVRRYHPGAGGLIITMDQKHAMQVAESMQRILGIRPVVAISDDADADKKIQAFTEGTDPWLITVRMVSEGVDIPRLRVLVFATNVVTELFFVQALGRIIRTRKGFKDYAAYFFVPNDERLHAYASSIEKERDAVLLIREQKTGEAPTPGDSIFIPLASEAEYAGSTFSHQDTAPSVEARVQDYLRMKPAMQGIPPQFVLEILKDFDMPLQPERIDIPTQAQSKPQYVLEEALRQDNERLVRACCKQHSIENFGLFSWHLNQAIGIEKIGNATLAQLEARKKLVSKWLREGPPYEVRHV